MIDMGSEEVKEGSVETERLAAKELFEKASKSIRIGVANGKVKAIEKPASERSVFTTLAKDYTWETDWVKYGDREVRIIEEILYQGLQYAPHRSMKISAKDNSGIENTLAKYNYQGSGIFTKGENPYSVGKPVKHDSEEFIEIKEIINTVVNEIATNQKSLKQ